MEFKTVKGLTASEIKPTNDYIKPQSTRNGHTYGFCSFKER